MRTCTTTLVNRNSFESTYGLRTLRALATIRKSEVGSLELKYNRKGKVRGVAGEEFTQQQLAAYKANLVIGRYEPYVSADFRLDNLNLTTCNR